MANIHNVYLVGTSSLMTKACVLRLNTNTDFNKKAEILNVSLPDNGEFEFHYIHHDTNNKEFSENAYIVAIADKKPTNTQEWAESILPCWERFNKDRRLLVASDSFSQAVDESVRAKLNDNLAINKTDFQSLAHSIVKLLAAANNGVESESLAIGEAIAQEAPEQTETTTEQASIDPSTLAAIENIVTPMAKIDGARAVAAFNTMDKTVISKIGDTKYDLTVAAEGNSEMIEALYKALSVGMVDEDEIHPENILITLDSQYRILAPYPYEPTVVFYLILDKADTNLALTNIKVKELLQNTD